MWEISCKKLFTHVFFNLRISFSQSQNSNFSACMIFRLFKKMSRKITVKDMELQAILSRFEPKTHNCDIEEHIFIKNLSMGISII